MTSARAPLTVATWNLEQASPRTRGAAQRKVMQELDVDIWLLTEVREDATLPYENVAWSPPRSSTGSRAAMRWSAVCSRWPVADCGSSHEGLALAVVAAPGAELLAGSSVLPWRGAGRHWPGDASAPLADRFRLALDDQRHQVRAAAAGRDVVWGGDLNLALQGPERAGAQQCRSDLVRAFDDLGLVPRTGHLPHRLPGLSTIDHVAVPRPWRATAEHHDEQLSDHALYLVRAERG